MVAGRKGRVTVQSDCDTAMVEGKWSQGFGAKLAPSNGKP